MHGENSLPGARVGDYYGSSPHARGKPAYPQLVARQCGLIPACAGKTSTRGPRHPRRWAHPRMRGENTSTPQPINSGLGSSPHARGKRGGAAGVGVSAGLIPACAGKTPSSDEESATSRAHPRIRGENARVHAHAVFCLGSSPHARGKPLGSSSICVCSRAHPRMRGENRHSRLVRVSRLGSSPHARGKRLSCTLNTVLRRLIPACAGKTHVQRALESCHAAHPRMRGENATRPE